MPLHPDDVVRKTFRTTSLRRGYDENEVDTFLEEVVVELRRLRRQVDENQAEIDRLKRQSAVGASTQLAVEEQQLEQVRREREAMAAELRDADQRIAQAKQDVASAEADRDARLEEIQVRLEEDLTVLKKRARDAREEARQLAEEAHLEERRLADRIAALRADAAAAAAAELGPDLVNELLVELQVDQASGPLADLRVIAALAETVRRDHFERGRVEAEQIRAEAEAERERIVAETTVRARGLQDAAERRHDELIQTAQAEADRMLAKAREERDGILAELTTRHEELQSRVEELERFQQGYRDRIRRLMADQIRALDAGEWRP
jgi:DivIVA domain-containing protein